MARNEDLVFFSEFPQDRILRQIVSLGPVSRSDEIEKGIVWKVVLKELQPDRSFEDQAQTFSCNVTAGYLPFLKLGSVWRGQHPIGNYTGLCKFEDIIVDAEDYGIFRRQDNEEDGLPAFFPDDPQYAELPAYVAASISGIPDVRYALVRCSELARFYFGMSSLLAQEMFNFDGDGLNDRLYDFDRTDWNEQKDRFDLALRQKVGREEGTYIAMQLAWKGPLDALKCLSASARSAFVSGKEVWPRMLLPFSGTNRWHVYGQVRPVLLTDDDYEEHFEEFLAITQITHCAMNRKIPSLNLDFPRAANKREFNDNAFPNPAIRPPGSKKPWTSRELPGVSVRHSVTVSIDMFAGCPGMEVENCTTSLDGGRQSEIGPQYIIAENHIDALSPVVGGAGAANVGDVSVVPDIPIKSSDYNIKEEENEEPDRSGLPNILDDFPSEAPREVVTLFGDVPTIFLPTIHAAAVVQWNWGHTVATSYDGIPISKEFDEISLLEFPESWGKSALNPDAPNGYRRALCIKIQSDFGQSFVLDIERVANYDNFGIHLVHFPDHNLVPLDLLGVFYFERLANSGRWPDRNSHNGNFLTEPIKHDFGMHAKVRMEGRVQTHIAKVFDRLVDT